MTTFKKLSLVCVTMSLLWPTAEMLGLKSVSIMTCVASCLSILLAVEFWMIDNDDDLGD